MSWKELRRKEINHNILKNKITGESPDTQIQQS